MDSLIAHYSARDTEQKAANARRSLEEGHVRLVRGVFRAT